MTCGETPDCTNEALAECLKCGLQVCADCWSAPQVVAWHEHGRCMESDGGSSVVDGR